MYRNVWKIKKSQGVMQQAVMQCRGLNAAQATDMVKLLGSADLPPQVKTNLAHAINAKVTTSTSVASAQIVSQKLQSCQAFFSLFLFLFAFTCTCDLSFKFSLFFAFMHFALIFHSVFYVF